MAPTRTKRAAGALLLAACSRSAPSAPATDQPAPAVVRGDETSIQPGDFVFVRGGESLYAQADASAPVATIERRYLQNVLRVVAVSGDWIEVVTEKQHHCSGSLQPGWAQVELFVPVSALQRVTRREFSAKYDDGTRVRLSAGQPVTDGTVRVALSDGWLVELPIELPSSAIGLSYAEHAPMIVSGPRGGEIGPTAPAMLAGKRFELSVGADLLGGTPTPAGYVVGIVGPCVDAEVLVSESDVVPPADRRAVVRDGSRLFEPLDGSDESGETIYTIAAGTPIGWPSGAKAGTVVATARFYEDPERVGEMLCWHPPGTCWREDSRFCFAASAVRAEQVNFDVEE